MLEVEVIFETAENVSITKEEFKKYCILESKLNLIKKIIDGQEYTDTKFIRMILEV